MDLAVGVIIGGAFNKIIDSMVKDIVMPVISWILGGDVDYSNWFLVLGIIRIMSRLSLRPKRLA